MFVFNIHYDIKLIMLYFRRVCCTAQGLSGQQVKTLTKHKQDVFDKDYLCELCIKIMTTIAGFLPDEDHDKYYVPRAASGLPGRLTPEEIANVLFPNLASWREEYLSRNGDKSDSTKEFLYSVIVYLSEIICQDGVLWVHNPAVTELTRLLDGRTGRENYLHWAQRKFDDIKREIKTIKSSKKKLQIYNAV
jgi:hypothetical protein